MNNNPHLLLSSISEGPVGQSLEITNLLRAKDSNKTFGNPSYREERINKSDFLTWMPISFAV